MTYWRVTHFRTRQSHVLPKTLSGECPKDMCELMNCVPDVMSFTGFDGLLIDFDEVVFVGQLESLDAAGELGNGFIFTERVQRIGTAFVFFSFMLDIRQSNCRGLRHRDQ